MNAQEALHRMVGESAAQTMRARVFCHQGMSIPRVRHWVWRLLGSSQFYDALIAMVAATGGVAASQKLIVDGWRVAGWLVAISAFGVCALSILRASVTYRQQAKRESLHELEGCLMIIHAILAEDDSVDSPKEAGLRLTVHVAISDRELQQVLDYVGDERGGCTAGRVFPMQCGIAGYVHRMGSPFAARRSEEDYEGYVRELMEDWGYTEDDARKLNPATKAWMAVPLVAPPKSKILGILYIDSTDRDYFTATRKGLLMTAASGVERFANRRYPNSQEPR